MKEIEKYPKHISPKFEMKEPNEEIKICEGIFTLKNKLFEIQIEGKVYYKWFPQNGAVFSGRLISNNINILNKNEIIEYSLIYKDMTLGKVFISEVINYSLELMETIILGVFKRNLFLGDKSINVDKVFFSIPNFRNILGEITSFNNNKGATRSRLSLEDSNYIIEIDKSLDYNNQIRELKNKGGFLILYSGTLKKKNGSISIKEALVVFESLDLFLTFLMGRKVSTIFHIGVLNKKEEWSDFSTKTNEIYKNPESWTLNYSIEGINKLFQEFSFLWEYENDRDFLQTLIHWYVEANNNSGYIEGSIIMAQTALELIYNWLLIEKKELIMGNDALNINASNKIRLLLSEIKVDKSIPESLHHLKDLIKLTSEYKNYDAPEMIVQIRNAIIHSQLKKRKKLSEIKVEAKAEALKLYILYIELSILYILKYKGKYTNRCSKELFPGDREADVPWL